MRACLAYRSTLSLLQPCLVIHPGACPVSVIAYGMIAHSFKKCPSSSLKQGCNVVERENFACRAVNEARDL